MHIAGDDRINLRSLNLSSTAEISERSTGVSVTVLNVGRYLSDRHPATVFVETIHRKFFDRGVAWHVELRTLPVVSLATRVSTNKPILLGFVPRTTECTKETEV